MAGNLGAVRGLLAHPAFAMSNPNMCYSMFLSFLRSTPTFHAADGSGYEFLADSILQARAAAPVCAGHLCCVGLHRCRDQQGKDRRFVNQAQHLSAAGF